jgi:hypothetical protein
VFPSISLPPKCQPQAGTSSLKRGFSRITGHGSRNLEQLLVRLFIESENDLLAANNDGPADQIRRLRHPPDRFRSRWRLLRHLFRSVEFVPRIQKLLVVARANQCIQLGFAQRFFVQVPRIQFRAVLEQETSCFAARRSSRLLQESQLRFRHSSSLRHKWPNFALA